MELEELKTKAKKGEIKLQDLDVEDILKFSQLGFLNSELVEYFNLELEDVKRIRRIKGLNNAEVENSIRNGIVLGKYLEYNYPDLGRDKIDMMVDVYMRSIGQVRKKEASYNKYIDRLDIHNIDFKEEMFRRGIEEEWRLNSLKSTVDLIGRSMNNGNIIKDYYMKLDDYEVIESVISYDCLKPKKRKRFKNATQKYYPRSEKVAKKAFAMAKYKCELNSEHPTFIRKKDNTPYMEPHHLIPLDFQDNFMYNLDI